MTCAILLVAAFAAHAAPVGAQRPATLPDTVALPPELDRVLRDYERAWSARDEVALADLFTPDGFVLRPGYPPAHGRDAIVEAYRGSGGPLTLRAYDWSISESAGWIVGGYTSRPDDPGEGGKFVLALTRVDGRWLIAADMDNGN